MGHVTIDPDKCSRELTCVAVCPAKVFTPRENAPPEPEGIARCISCGHCLAACPTGALTLNKVSAQALESVDETQLPEAEAVRRFLLSRRSIRAYRSRPVPMDVIEDLLDVARYAPSASNRQNISWKVVHDPVKVHEIAGLTAEWCTKAADAMPESRYGRFLQGFADAFAAGEDLICRGAPHLLLAVGPSELHVMAQDAAIAVTYVELAARSLRLGTCWAGLVTGAAGAHPPLAEYLKLGEDETVYGGVMLGLPRFAYRRVPPRKKARYEVL